jgi:hypothetical protein
VADWSQGVPLARIQALVEYWRTKYDWRRCEAMLNRFGQFKTQIDGLGFHLRDRLHGSMRSSLNGVTAITIPRAS